MYSIALGPLTLDFDSAMIMVPSNGDYDWMNEDWIEVRQEIEVVQGETSATVIGLAGRFTQTGPHIIEIVSPRIFVESEVVEHLLSKHHTFGLSENTMRGAVHTMHFPWGKLVSLDWTKLGYAPGGVEYCLLPTDGPAISTGYLRLDWTSVRLRSSS
ncbi:hypothetical protein [Paraburkholderia hospita]|uniref:hypothetical protein n=1 Tax=Paraburkholderia hospita TaxID=169430 RepID=UPI0008A7BE9A|nr:hypothetical protein [Paraburkholderia hospita]SEI20717.1 hypothetical protein SAMN05192544_10382 [Paraburkholderia hospita]